MIYIVSLVCVYIMCTHLIIYVMCTRTYVRTEVTGEASGAGEHLLHGHDSDELESSDQG